MCQWHMFSTDRSGAEKWECVARNNPQASKLGAFDPNIINIEGEYPKQSDLFTNVIKCV